MLPASGEGKEKNLAPTPAFFAACTGGDLWSRLSLRPNLLQYRRPITRLPELIKQAIHLCTGKETSSILAACPPSASGCEEWQTWAQEAPGETEEAEVGSLTPSRELKTAVTARADWLLRQRRQQKSPLAVSKIQSEFSPCPGRVRSSWNVA